MNDLMTIYYHEKEYETFAFLNKTICYSHVNFWEESLLFSFYYKKNLSWKLLHNFFIFVRNIFSSFDTKYKLYLQVWFIPCHTWDNYYRSTPVSHHLDFRVSLVFRCATCAGDRTRRSTFAFISKPKCSRSWLFNYLEEENI